MTIDIISYTEEQYAALSDEQILEVRSAQMKKNDRTAAFAKSLAKEKQNLIDNGTFYSGIWEKLKAEIEAEYNEDVEHLRESLLFYLKYSACVQKEVVTNGYPVDYSLEVNDRFLVVKEYYLTTYSDPDERYEAFLADTIAPSYLGETYAPMSDYLWTLANKE